MIELLDGVKLNKWQIALLLGTPLLVGTSLYIYKKSQTSIKKGATGIEKVKETDEHDSASSKQSTGKDDKVSAISEAIRYKNEGNACFKHGKYDEAIACYDKAIANCSPENKNDLAIFYQNRAAAYEMLKKWKDVKEDCSKCIAINPKYTKAYFRRAKAHEATRDIIECLNDITATCILEKFENPSSLQFADRVVKKSGEIDARKAMKDRVTFLPSKSYIDTYFRCYINDPIRKMELPKIPKESATGFLKAKIALEEGNYNDIIPACTEELENSEAESQYKQEALLLRGTFNLLSGAHVVAKKDFDEIINNESADETLKTYALIRRACLKVQYEIKEEGFAEFEEARKLQPDNADVYHQYAQVHILCEQLPEAFSKYEKAIELAPNHGMAHMQKLYAEYRMAASAENKFILAKLMNEFKKTVEKFPDLVDCYCIMAQVLSDQQQYPEADQLYEKAIKLDPKNAPIYIHRALMRLQWTGDVESCVELMHKALEVDDKCDLVYETLGTVEVQRSNLDRAIELFNIGGSLAKSESEMIHLFSLRNAAIAQKNAIKTVGVNLFSTMASLNNTHVALP